jgi:hypothetical protein
MARKLFGGDLDDHGRMIAREAARQEPKLSARPDLPGW